MNHRRQLFITSLLLALACGLAFAPDAYLPMLARAFALWWAMAFTAISLVLLLKRCWWPASASMLGALIVLPFLQVPSQDLIVPGARPHLRIAHLNVLQPNTRRSAVLAEILGADADLVSVQEVSPEWALSLREGLRSEYPYHVITPRTNCYGIALFSRLPLHHAEVIVMAGAPLIQADVRSEAGPVRVFIVHATSPGSPGQFARRNAQLRGLADRITRSELPTVLIGDLNTVHWDDAYRRLCAGSGLRPLNDPGMATWPSIGPIAFIPLDHALVRGPLRASAISSFSIPGSDHRGLLAQLHISHAH